MSTSPRPIFLRPRELVPNDSGEFFTIDGGAAVTDFEDGVFHNSYALAYSFAGYLKQNADASIDIRVNDDLLVEIYNDSGDDIVIAWSTYSDLGAWIGFTGSSTTLTDGGWTTAQQLPWGTWCAEFQVADQDYWKTVGTEIATGITSQNGTWAGTTNGSAVYHRRMKLNAELAYRVMKSKRTSTSYMTAETFFNDSLTAQASDATYCSPQGFYVYPDVNDLISDCNGVSSTNPWDEGDDTGIEFNRTSGSDNKVFCHTSPQMLPDWTSEAFFPRSTLRYSFEIGMNTAPAESFTFFDYS